MDYEKILDNFADKLTSINLYQRAAKDSAKSELRKLNEYAEQLKEHPALEGIGTSTHAMYFYHPHTGTASSYGFRESTVEERAKLVILQKNKQYCWLLAEAYEQFEDFLEEIYAYLGELDHSNWLMSDFGNVQFSDLESKDYDWFLERARRKKDVPNSILIRLRTLYPKLQDSETQNKLNVNLKVAIELVAMLRHIIVHKGSVVDSREEFLKLVLQKCGLWNNGNYHEGYEEFVSKFLGREEYERQISLLEIPTHLGRDMSVALDIHHDVFGELTGYLMAYSVLICENIAAIRHDDA